MTWNTNHKTAAEFAREQGELAAQKATELEERVNTAIGDTTDSAEVIDARKGFVNLRERLDTEIGEVAQQLAHTKEDANKLFIQKNSTDVYTPIGNITPKLIYNSNNIYYVVTQKPNGNGYVRIRMRDGIVMSDSSYGAPGELIRLNDVYNVLDCYLVKHTEKAMNNSSLWNTSQVSDRGILIDIKNLSGTVAVVGEWIEYDVIIPDGVNFIQTMVYGTATASTNVDISVDGNVVQSGVSFRQPTATFFRINTPISPGAHTIRFTTKTAESMSIVGTSCVDLKDYKKGYSHDKNNVIWTSQNPYISNAGSSDYAFVDADNGLYCGSYHGGEVRNRLLLLLDGIPVTIGVGEYKVGNIFEIEQDTLIAGKLNSYTRQIFKLDGAREMEMVFEGDINVTSFNTNMTCTSHTFKDVLYPKRIKVGTSGFFYLPEGCNYVVQRNPDNNQKLITITNNVTLTEENYAPFISVTDGQTSKLYKRNYYSNNPINFKNGFFRLVHIFE